MRWRLPGSHPACPYGTPEVLGKVNWASFALLLVRSCRPKLFCSVHFTVYWLFHAQDCLRINPASFWLHLCQKGVIFGHLYQKMRHKVMNTLFKKTRGLANLKPIFCKVHQVCWSSVFLGTLSAFDRDDRASVDVGSSVYLEMVYLWIAQSLTLFDQSLSHVRLYVYHFCGSWHVHIECTCLQNRLLPEHFWPFRFSFCSFPYSCFGAYTGWFSCASLFWFSFHPYCCIQSHYILQVCNISVLEKYAVKSVFPVTVLDLQTLFGI